MIKCTPTWIPNGFVWKYLEIPIESFTVLVTKVRTSEFNSGFSQSGNSTPIMSALTKDKSYPAARTPTEYKITE